MMVMRAFHHHALNTTTVSKRRQKSLRRRRKCFRRRRQRRSAFPALRASSSPPPKDDDSLGGFDELDEEEEETTTTTTTNEEGIPNVLPPIGGSLLPKEQDGHVSGYVAIVGRPNAGKSTLLNAILGTKLSIVNPKPQTTRHRISGVLSDARSQMVVLDTPGVMRTAFNKLDERMLKSVKSSVTTADCLIVVVDGDDFTAEKDFEHLLMLDDDADDDAKMIFGKIPTAICVNKCDRIKDVERIKELMRYFRKIEGISEVIPISALNDTGVKEVVEWAKEQLPNGPSYFSKEYLSEHPERFFVAEIIREKIFELYSQEVPYCSSVWVEELKERKPPAKDLIRATIYVERQSQVGIIVGENGAAMKKLSTEARKDIETFLEKGVFLELKVKSKPGWRSNDKSLREFGLEDPNKTTNPDFREIK